MENGDEESMSEYIKREDVLKLATETPFVSFVNVIELINNIPAADVVERDLYEGEKARADNFEAAMKDALAELEQTERKRGKWIPFELRPLDDEEKQEHPEWDFILTGQLPDDGQRILVNVVYKTHEHVQMDEYYSDCDGSYLDSGYEIGSEVTHWMPLPEPPKEGET